MSPEPGDPTVAATKRQGTSEPTTPTSPTERRGSAFMSFFSSILGSKNPLAQPADPVQHTVWLLDNTAYQAVPNDSDTTPSWHAEVVACIFEKESRKDMTKIVATIADKIGLDGSVGSHQEARSRIEHRIAPFITAISPSRTLTLQIPLSPTQFKPLGPSDRNGILSQTVEIGHLPIEDGAVLRPRLQDFDEPVTMHTSFAKPDGWLVISDIDDTIKRTLTLEPTGLLQTTFADIPEPIAGMPELYEYLDSELVPTWFYLSASPYNLYPFLHGFVHEHYLPGTIVLRDYSWMDISGLIKSFTEKTEEYKVDRMEKIHGWFPQRRVLCIGDSTQKDPEAYAEMYLRYPEWIHAIAIRKVLDVAHMEEKNERERFERAFEGVPAHVWTVFEDPVELYAFIDGVGMEEQVL